MKCNTVIAAVAVCFVIAAPSPAQTPAANAADPGSVFPGVRAGERPHSEARRILSLDECLRQAIEANYSVSVARNRERIARNNLTPAPFLPTVGAGAGQLQEQLEGREVYPAGSGQSDLTRDYATNAYSADLELSWRLFDGLAMFAAHDTAKELLKLGELNLKESIESLVTDLSGQYYYIVTEEDRLDATKLYLEISTLRYNQALEKYMIGSISGLEMKQAKIDLNADSSRLVQQQQVIRNAYIQLYEMMNIDLTTDAVLSDTIAPNGSLSLDALRDNALRSNTAICMARSGQRVSDLDLRIARSSRWPTLDFEAGYRFNRNDSGIQTTRFNQIHGSRWGFTASVKLFDRLETNRKIRNARLEAGNSDLLYRQTELAVVSQIAQLYNTYRKNVLMIGFEQESAEVARANLDAAMEMYRLGSMSGVEFREIQRSYLETVERMLDAVFQAKLSEINLLYLSGQSATGATSTPD